MATIAEQSKLDRIASFVNQHTDNARPAVVIGNAVAVFTSYTMPLADATPSGGIQTDFVRTFSEARKLLGY